MLFFPDGTPFAEAYSPFVYRPATENETTNRIFLQISVEGISTEAFVDTGSPFVILEPQIAEPLNIDRSQGERIDNFNIRGDLIKGDLLRMTITILAAEGRNLSVEATVFVPELTPSQEWKDLPTILGLVGFLERIRFAINPTNNHFYFGEI
jgi:predicted aspartyl protease